MFIFLMILRKCPVFRPSARPTNSYSLRSYRIGRLSIEFESKKYNESRRDGFSNLRGAEKKPDYCLGAAKREKKKSGVEVGNVEIWHMKFVKVPIPGPRGGLTLYVFLLKSCCVYPTWFGQVATERKQQHDSVVQGPPCHHRAQGSSVNPFGYPPLSDHRAP